MAPEISKETYARRRAELMRRMAGGIAIVATAPPAVYSNDVEYRYRPDSDFYYLTGFREPEAVAVIAPGNDAARYILFVRPRDPERELWAGARAGVEGATEVHGADAAFPIDQLESELARLLGATDKTYFALGRNQSRTDQVLEILRRARAERPRTGSGPVALLDPSTLLHEMRMYKSPEEIAMMREAARISCIAHRDAMIHTRAGQFEYEVEALVESTFRRHGAAGPAYPTIAAAGANATILHYQDNDQRMDGTDMMLLDAGAELGCYSADITRTYPISTAFSPLHRDVYTVVLNAQEAAIEAAQPGAPFDAPHQRAVRVLCEGLVSMGLLDGDVDDLIEREEYRRYFMHRTSHWIGVDVHDVGLYRQNGSPRLLEPGMVLTIEPGLYVAANAKEAPERFRGIGIRIEDDVLITEHGNDVLSADAPKDIAGIEALRREAA
jgi:Xaa-Pro aminopeptidase